MTAASDVYKGERERETRERRERDERETRERERERQSERERIFQLMLKGLIDGQLCLVTEIRSGKVNRWRVIRKP